ncbi:hypothetical protein K3495_g2686 [Podosphaera aphanis]|nr:hypothetical protein K3495_g2686 [Podosphaera aphanis]
MADAPMLSESQICVLKDQLYASCYPIQAEDPQHVFHQNELQELGDVALTENIKNLLLVIQKLLDEKLFKVVNNSQGMGWMVRNQEEAKKYRSLTAEQELVYAVIDDSGEQGVWSKAAKARTNLHEVIFSASIRHLVAKNYICEIKSAENPNRKTYIRSELRPHEKVSGGPWFSDGELDEAFVSAALMLLQKHIQVHSWSRSKASTTSKKLTGLRPEEVKAQRKRGLEQNRSGPVEFLPMPPGYDKYLSLEELTLKVEESAVFNQTLTPFDVQQLLDTLIFDNKIEKVMCGTRWGYRTLRATMVNEDQKTDPISEVPCGRCPVFDLCEEGGPVAPSECVYMDEWLAF